MKIYEPMLILADEQVASGANAWDVWPIDLSLAYLEGIKIYRVELAPGYNVAPSTYSLCAGITLDSNEAFADEDDFWDSKDIIARAAIRCQLTTSGLFGLMLPVVTDFRPDGFDVVRNLGLVFCTDVVGVHTAYAIYYKRVGYTEGDLVSVMAIR